MVIMTFDLRLKIPEKINKFARNKCIHNKLKNPLTNKLFQNMIMEKINEQKIICLVNILKMIHNFNSIIFDTVKVILGKYREKPKIWIINELLGMCDLIRSLTKY